MVLIPCATNIFSGGASAATHCHLLRNVPSRAGQTDAEGQVAASRLLSRNVSSCAGNGHGERGIKKSHRPLPTGCVCLQHSGACGIMALHILWSAVRVVCHVYVSLYFVCPCGRKRTVPDGRMGGTRFIHCECDVSASFFRSAGEDCLTAALPRCPILHLPAEGFPAELERR